MNIKIYDVLATKCVVFLHSMYMREVVVYDLYLIVVLR